MDGSNGKVDGWQQWEGRDEIAAVEWQELERQEP